MLKETPRAARPSSTGVTGLPLEPGAHEIGAEALEPHQDDVGATEPRRGHARLIGRQHLSRQIAGDTVLVDSIAWNVYCKGIYEGVSPVGIGKAASDAKPVVVDVGEPIHDERECLARRLAQHAVGDAVVRGDRHGGRREGCAQHQSGYQQSLELWPANWKAYFLSVDQPDYACAPQDPGGGDHEREHQVGRGDGHPLAQVATREVEHQLQVERVTEVPDEFELDDVGANQHNHARDKASDN